MNTAEALATVELIEVNWPRTSLGDDTKQMWAQAIVEAEPQAVAADGYEAIRDLATHQTWPPALAEVILGIYGARLSRQATRGQLQPPAEEAEEFVTFAQFLHDNPDMAERVKKIAATQFDRKHKDNPTADTLARFLIRDGVKAE